jgi:hypothetical protein
MDPAIDPKKREFQTFRECLFKVTEGQRFSTTPGAEHHHMPGNTATLIPDQAVHNPLYLWPDDRPVGDVIKIEYPEILDAGSDAFGLLTRVFYVCQ